MPQKLIGEHLAGDAAEVFLHQAQIFCQQVDHPGTPLFLRRLQVRRGFLQSLYVALTGKKGQFAWGLSENRGQGLAQSLQTLPGGRADADDRAGMRLDP